MVQIHSPRPLFPLSIQQFTLRFQLQVVVHPKNLREADFGAAVQRIGPRALRQKVSLNQASRPPEDADAFAVDSSDDPAELSSFHLMVV